jgi:ribonuclease P protein component
LLPARNRIRKNKDIQTAFREGNKVVSAGVRVVLRPNQKKITRFAFSISSKGLKKASARNKLKRRLSEIVLKQKENIIAGYDVIIQPDSFLGKKTPEEIKGQIKKALLKARLIAKNKTDD